MRNLTLLAILFIIFWTETVLSQSSKISGAIPVSAVQASQIEASRAARFDSLRRALGLSSALQLEWKTSANGLDTFRVVDNFNRTEIGSDWVLDPRYWVIVDGELSLTENADQEWQYLAAFLPVYNHRDQQIYSVSYRWGKNADSVGIREGAMALMLDAPSTNASGYWLWQRYGSVWLWIVKNGGWEYTEGQGKEVEVVPGLVWGLLAKDRVTAVIRNEPDTVFFDYYVEGMYDGTVKDPTKEFPTGEDWWVGLFMHGERLRNQIDDFTVAWLGEDNVSPANVTDLQVLHANASSTTLEWTSPGDNGWDGRANRIELRYATSPITSANFSAAPLVANVSAPLAPGLRQHFTVTGLQEQTTYYFALRVFDEVNNVSGISNVTQASTLAMATNAVVISGNSQTAQVHTKLPVPLVVKLATATGQPAANFPVEFRVTRGGGSLSSNLAIKNESFELANTGANTPADWTLAGTPSDNEVSLSTLNPWKGAKSLQINTVRDGVGVSQMLNYPVIGNYTMSFYAKVTSPAGAGLRVTWRLNDAAGNPVDKIIDLIPQSGTVNGNQWTPYVISASNGSVKPRSLSFKTFGGAGKFFIDEIKINRNTDGKGEITVNWTLGDTAMTQTVLAEAKVDNLTRIGSPLLFSAIATIGPAKKMVAVGGNNQSGSVGQVLPSPLVVKVTDEFGNGIANRSVKFAVQAGGGKLNGNLTTYSANTDQQGLAQAKWTLGPVFGDTNKVQVSSTGLNAVNFVAVIATPSQVTKAAAPAVGSAGQRLRQPLVVRVADANGVKISGYPVIFKIRQGNGTINDSTQAVVRTDSAGEARAYPVLGPTPGAQNQIEAWINYNGKILPSPVLRFTVMAARLKQFALVSGNNQTGAACEVLAEPFKVKVVDSLGVGIKGQRVTFTVTKGGGKLVDDTTKVVLTDAQGIAQVKLTLGPELGGNQVTARAAVTLAGSPATFTAIGRVGPAAVLHKFSGDSLAALANMVLPFPLVVRVTDKCGNDAANVKVTFAVKAGGGKVNGKDSVVVLTDANGRAQVSWQVGAKVGKFNNKVEVRVFNDDVEIANSPLIFVASATPGTLSAERSEVRATGPIPADGISQSRVTVYVRDHAGNPIAGEAVTIKVSPSGNHFIDQPTELTDQEGKVTAAFASTSAGAKTVTAHVLDGIELTRGATVQVTPLAAQNMSLVGGNNQTCNLQSAAVKPLCVKIEDKFGNGVPKHEVRFTIKGDGRIYEPAPIRTDTNGIACATFIGGTRVGQSQIWAESTSLANSLIIFVANVVESVPLQLLEVSGNLQRGLAGQILPKPVAVRVIDDHGRPVFGAPVKLDVTFGGGAINDRDLLNAETDEWGEVRASWRLGSTSEPQTIRVESAGLQNSPIDFRAEVVSSFAARLKLHSGQNAVGEVSQTLAQPLCVRVADANGNSVNNVEVLFELIQGSGSFSATVPMTVKQVLTTEEGLACVQMTFGTDAGWRHVRASVYGVRGFPLSGSPVDFHIYGKALAAQTMKAIERTNKQRGTKGKPLNFPLQVRVQDQLGNPVPDEIITFTITSGGGNFNGVTQFEAKTDSNGIASAAWMLGPSSSANEANATPSPAWAGQPASIVFQATGFDNNFPVFLDAPDRRVSEGDMIEFTVSATDADGDPISYGVKNLSGLRGAQFDSLRSRIFRWRTDLNSAGHYEVSFLARDGKGGVDEELVIIEVKNRNRMPYIVSRFPIGLDMPTQSDTVIAFNTVLPMRVEALDPDNDLLQYRWFLNGAYAPQSGATNTFLLRSNDFFNTVKVLVFDREDTTSTSWMIQVPVKSNDFNAALTPKTFALQQNYPNPFFVAEIPAGASPALSGGNSTTQIRYALPQSAYVTLTIFNALGQEVRRLVADQQPAGYHLTVWDGRDEQGKAAPSGIYHYRLQAKGLSGASDFVATKKMVMAK